LATEYSNEAYTSQQSGEREREREREREEEEEEEGVREPLENELEDVRSHSQAVRGMLTPRAPMVP
jgi:hypothetical protein